MEIFEYKMCAGFQSFLQISSPNVVTKDSRTFSWRSFCVLVTFGTRFKPITCYCKAFDGGSTWLPKKDIYTDTNSLFLTRNVTVYVYYTMLWSTSCRIDVLYSRHYNFGRNLRIRNTVLACAIVISSTGLANLAIEFDGHCNNSALRNVIQQVGAARNCYRLLGFWSPVGFFWMRFMCSHGHAPLDSRRSRNCTHRPKAAAAMVFTCVLADIYLFRYLVVT